MSEKNKITINKNSTLYTTYYLSNNKVELYKVGVVAEHELEHVCIGYDPLTKNHKYDDRHIFIELNDSMFIINIEDVLS